MDKTEQLQPGTQQGTSSLTAKAFTQQQHSNTCLSPLTSPAFQWGVNNATARHMN